MIKLILRIIAAIAGLLFNRSEPDAVAKREKAKRESEAKDAVDEVAKKDTDAVNRRLKNLLPLLATGLFLMAGCVRTEYIEESAKVIPLEHKGKPGWWVPEGRMAQIMERLELKGKGE